VAAGLHRAHHHFAGVDADPDLDASSPLTLKVLAAAAQVVTRRDSRVDRALRMIFVRDRGAKQCEDAIAGRLHDITAVALDRIDHQLDCRIDNRARLFRIKILHQLGRALDVGEQRRHGLALALQRCCVIGLSDRDRRF
jgi:hypothetical protein